MKRERTAVYPGSFDPVTYGHMDVVRRALRFLDTVIVAVSADSMKDPLFSVRERTALLRDVFRGEPRVRVEHFRGLLVEYLERQDVTLVIRGLRAVSDFEYEFQMVLANRTLMKSMETVFLMPREEYFYISSSVVKEIARLGGSVESFVPKSVEEAIRRKYRAARGKKGGRRHAESETETLQQQDRQAQEQ